MVSRDGGMDPDRSQFSLYFPFDSALVVSLIGHGIIDVLVFGRSEVP